MVQRGRETRERGRERIGRGTKNGENGAGKMEKKWREREKEGTEINGGWRREREKEAPCTLPRFNMFYFAQIFSFGSLLFHMHINVRRPAKSPDLGRRLSGFHCFSGSPAFK